MVFLSETRISGQKHSSKSKPFNQNHKHNDRPRRSDAREGPWADGLALERQKPLADPPAEGGVSGVEDDEREVEGEFAVEEGLWG